MQKGLFCCNKNKLSSKNQGKVLHGQSCLMVPLVQFLIKVVLKRIVQMWCRSVPFCCVCMCVRHSKNKEGIWL